MTRAGPVLTPANRYAAVDQSTSGGERVHDDGVQIESLTEHPLLLLLLLRRLIFLLFLLLPLLFL